MPRTLAPPIVFCHGLESGPWGRKSVGLRDAGFDVEAIDFRGQDLDQRVATLTAALRGRRDQVIVGSSFGGITAVLAAMQLPETVGALVLCAPALRHGGADLRAVAPTSIIHGTRDDVVPIETSRAFAAANPGVELVEVDDDHRLEASLPRIVDLVTAACRAARPRPGAG